MASLIRATNLWGYDDLVRQLGEDPEPLLARFHIPPAEQRQDADFLPYRNVALLLEASARGLNCPDFGQRMVGWQGLDILGPVAVIARNTATVREALQAIARYLYIHSPALELRLVSSVSAETLVFGYRMNEMSPLQTPQAYELSLANATQMLRMLAGADANPAQVSFMHERLGAPESYAETFGCRTLFSQRRCGFELPASLGRRPVGHAHAQTLQLATAYLESQFAPGAATLAARVVELVRRLMTTGHCDAETIAEGLAMHPRTLQRRLAEEGKRYDTLLDEERKRQTEHYLAQSGLHLSQVTGLLGYAEQSSLNRSCQRWFGMTPRQYREQLLRERS